MGRVPRAEKEKLIHDLELIKDNSLLSETDEERHHRQFVDRIYESYAGIFECEKSTEEVEGFRKYVHQVWCTLSFVQNLCSTHVNFLHIFFLCKFAQNKAKSHSR